AGARRRPAAAGDEHGRPGFRPDLPRLRQRLLRPDQSGHLAADGLLHPDAVLPAGHRPVPVAGQGAAATIPGTEGCGMIRSTACALPALLVLATGHPVMASDDPVVTAPAGPVRGEALEGVDVFRGIPYALPPTGWRRWRPPAEVPAWRETRDATRFGPACP